MLRSARVFVDRTDSALREAGDIILAIADGLFAAGDIVGDLGAVLAGRVVGRSTPACVSAWGNTSPSAVRARHLTHQKNMI